MITVTLFAIFYFLCVAYEQYTAKRKFLFLAVACIVFAIIAGLRSLNWPDTGVYYLSFELTPGLFDITSEDSPKSYSEKGFWALGILTKTFTNNYQIYFCVVSLFTFFFLYKDLRQYSLYPLIGLCVYVARFYSGRNFMQIRAGVAYAILLLGVKYIQEKDWKRYFLVVFVAYLFHHSAIIAIPLYFFCNWIKIKPKIIVGGLLLAWIIGAFFQGFIHNFIEDNAEDLNIGARYTEAGGERAMTQGAGILNPMIYFQSFLLLAYTFLEKKIAPMTKYYYAIRSSYFYSTLILIIFCSYKVLSGRTSTVFATLEIGIIPSIIYLFNKRNRTFAFIALGVVLVTIFYMNFNSRIE